MKNILNLIQFVILTNFIDDLVDKVFPNLLSNY